MEELKKLYGERDFLIQTLSFSGDISEKDKSAIVKSLQEITDEINILESELGI